MTEPAPNRIAAVRLADPVDRNAVAHLRSRALNELAALRGGTLYEAPVIGGDRLWLGLIDDEIVGYLAARVEGHLGKVDGIYVEPECRGVGVGEAMMAAALAWFRDQDCIGVDAVALPGARSTKNFFEETGFTARLLTMHRPFGAPGGAAGASPK